MRVAIVAALVAVIMLTFARVTSFRSTRTSGRISVVQKRSTKPCARLSKGVGARADVDLLNEVEEVVTAEAERPNKVESVEVAPPRARSKSWRRPHRRCRATQLS